MAEEGVKESPPFLPTITVTVAALAIVGWKTKNGAMIASNTAMRSEEVFIASITTACDADSLVQFGKSNTPVTSRIAGGRYQSAALQTIKRLSCEAPGSSDYPIECLLFVVQGPVDEIEW